MLPNDEKRLVVVMTGPSPTAKGGIASVINGYKESGFPANIQIRHIATSVDGSPAAKGLAAVQGIAAAVRAMRTADIVHIHMSAGASFVRKGMVLAAARATNVPAVLHIHTSAFASRSSRLPRSLLRCTLSNADRVVALSPHWKNALHDIAPEARIVVVPNGVAIPAEPTDVSDGPFVCLAKIGRAKGSFDIVRALALSERPHLRVVFGGDGDIESVRAEARRLGVDERITFLGWIDGQRRDALLREASAFVLPSHAEGLPMSLLEAMAYGLPTIATRVGSIPEVIKDGHTGVLIDLEDQGALAAAMVSLADDPALRSELGSRGRLFVANNFGVESTTQRLVEVWQDVSEVS